MLGLARSNFSLIGGMLGARLGAPIRLAPRRGPPAVQLLFEEAPEARLPRTRLSGLRICFKTGFHDWPVQAYFLLRMGAIRAEGIVSRDRQEMR